jgi:hypothetical protein
LTPDMHSLVEREVLLSSGIMRYWMNYVTWHAKPSNLQRFAKNQKYTKVAMQNKDNKASQSRTMRTKAMLSSEVYGKNEQIAFLT